MLESSPAPKPSTEPLPAVRTDGAPLFPMTRWSLVLRTQGVNDEQSVRALGELMQGYWKPLYVFARRSGMDAPDAEDAVQSFCESMVRRDTLRTADRERGKLRSFLLTGFQNHLRTQHRDQHRLKRGGSVQVISLEDAEAALDQQSSTQGETPDKAFDRRWAYTLLEHVMNRLRQDYTDRGRGEVFAALEPALVWNAQMSYEELGKKLDMAPSTVAQSVTRMRQRYRAMLEQEIGDTVDGPEAMAEEREHLIRVLSGG